MPKYIIEITSDDLGILDLLDMISSATANALDDDESICLYELDEENSTICSIGDILFEG